MTAAALSLFDAVEPSESLAQRLLGQIKKVVAAGTRPFSKRAVRGWAQLGMLAWVFSGGFSGALAADTAPGVDLSQPAPLTVSLSYGRGTVAVRPMQTLYSELGETKPDFILRAASVLRAFAHETGFEGCGLIWTHSNGNAWAIPLTTNGSHIACVVTRVEPSQDPAHGFFPTDENIHVHPEQRAYRLNRADLNISPDANIRKMPLNSMRRLNQPGFSYHDHAGGADYVVDQGRLLHRSADGQVADLGEVPLSPAPARPVVHMSQPVLAVLDPSVESAFGLTEPSAEPPMPGRRFRP